MSCYMATADLSKLTQHAHELIFIDDPSVGPLALEGDHSRHSLASLRSSQIYMQTGAVSKHMLLIRQSHWSSSCIHSFMMLVICTAASQQVESCLALHCGL